MKMAVLAIKVVFSLLLLLFGAAVYLGGNYWQTLSLLAIIVALFYWPIFRTTRAWSLGSRLLTIGLVIVLQFTVFRSPPKESIYLSDAAREEIRTLYALKKQAWPQGAEDIWLDTEYGQVHVLAYGDTTLPPLLLFHAASMGAHSWAENIAPLVGKYRLYAIDNIGEGNLSALADASVFPGSSKEIADLYAHLADALGVERAPVFGASNGGYIAQVYACFYPERVESLVLFGPMGITPLSGKSIFMLAVSSMYPLPWVRHRVAHWAFGDDPYCHRKYGDWFDAIMKGTIPSVAKPEPMTEAQKAGMKLPILLFLGSSDPIVGDVQIARRAAEAYPNIRIEVLASGHLVGIEQRDYVNQQVSGFLEGS